jgi:hypothetical protein
MEWIAELVAAAEWRRDDVCGRSESNGSAADSISSDGDGEAAMIPATMKIAITVTATATMVLARVL